MKPTPMRSLAPCTRAQAAADSVAAPPATPATPVERNDRRLTKWRGIGFTSRVGTPVRNPDDRTSVYAGQRASGLVRFACSDVQAHDLLVVPQVEQSAGERGRLAGCAEDRGAAELLVGLRRGPRDDELAVHRGDE